MLAPGGRIVLIGQDWEMVAIDSDDPGLTRTIVHARAELVTGPRTARRYRNLLLDAGFREVTVEVHTDVLTGVDGLSVLVGMADAVRSAGAVTEARVGGWAEEQQRRAHDDRLFLAVPVFVASATR
ncbi:hypothetical protein GCM10027290_19930 [Micromonospora sonneratiae]|uniref:Methyltransferase domain-containing protein n=1 Tax=Micromonospora sonneratiae TaxID=1184706 RepID=A0ABW3YKN1_9ACTN